MKNIIHCALHCFCMVLLVAVGSTAISLAGLMWLQTQANAADVWSDRQTVVHTIADLARSIGLPEDNAIIVECQRLWWADATAESIETVETEDAVRNAVEPPEWVNVPLEYDYTVSQDEEGDEESAKMTYIGKIYIRGYDACYQCCGKTDGITATGAVATVGRTMASSNRGDLGKTMYIDGVGERTVEDLGGGYDLFCSDHPECYAVTGWYECWWVGD